jgi:pentatricopeptide repeat protein
MHRISKLARAQNCNAASAIASTPLPPNVFLPRLSAAGIPRHRGTYRTTQDLAAFFFSSLSYASSCEQHRRPRPRFEQQHDRGFRSRKIFQDARPVSAARPAAPRATTPSLQTGAAQGHHRGNLPKSLRHFGTKDLNRQAREFGGRGFFDSTTQDFAKSSTLPLGFYDDLERVAGVKFDKTVLQASGMKYDPTPPQASIKDQMQLLQSVRELEEKLARARSALDRSLKQKNTASLHGVSARQDQTVLLSKQDYMNLVDLYYYSHQSRSEPGSPDYSPSPLFIDDISFGLSGDFSEPVEEEHESEIDEEDISPLKHVEEMLRSQQLKEISLMQAFVDLLLDDRSSNRALFEVYQMFPRPGVAYFPTGMIRLFLQRMSTPTKRSEKSTLRYLSLIDDMQRADRRITTAEWSSAIYLAGRSFSKVNDGDVAKSFGIWREMEQEAGVKATHVTFNILFDIAVRAEKHGLAQNLLKEMQERGLRLNRLGRVSLIWYYGMRGDGDGVRRTYRDFVEAGEIVDTLVLNCVMASLVKAQEPVAAEQIYERMKQLQTRLRKGIRDDGKEGLFMRYPPPGSIQIGMEMASNSLGRVLLNAARLRDVLPEHHLQLQANMPLTPDQITFRSLLSHHASTSGDLDRLTVLINDKTDIFELPLTSLDFQLLFKGFALHGAGRSESKWTNERLDMVWKACTDLIRQSSKQQPSKKSDVEVPTVEDVDSGNYSPNDLPFTPHVKKPDAWDEFILDLAAFPRERLKKPVPMSNDFFPEDGEPDSPDVDKGTEYTLPDAMTLSLHREPSRRPILHEVDASHNLVIWVIRAYARCTANRRRVEEVWFLIRKLWKPRDHLERDAVVRVLRRALRDCDDFGKM